MDKKTRKIISTGIWEGFRLAALVIVLILLILSLSSCLNRKAPIAVEVPAEATNLGDTQALADFWETYDSLAVVEDREWAIWEEFNETSEKGSAIDDERTGLYAGPKLEKLAEEGLDIVAEQEEILGRIRQAI